MHFEVVGTIANVQTRLLDRAFEFDRYCVSGMVVGDGES